MLQGKRKGRPFFQLLDFNIGKQRVTHQFLYMLECPVPSLGRDLLTKVRAQITFKRGRICVNKQKNHKTKKPASKSLDAQVYVLQDPVQTEPEIPQEIENAVIPLELREGHKPQNR